MNTRQAFAILKTPRFGDPLHISAVKHIEDVELARIAMVRCRHRKCPVCGGKGYFSKNEFCNECGGTGTCGACHCFAGMGAEAVIEARGK